MKAIVLLVSVFLSIGHCHCHYVAFEKIEAEDYSSIYSSIVYHQDSRCAAEADLYRVGHNYPDAKVGYYGVDLESGASSVTIQLWGFRPDAVTGNIYLHLDSPTTQPIVTVPVGPTSTDCVFTTVTTPLSTSVSGVHDLYFTFDASNNDCVVDYDWFYFNR